MNLPDEYYAQGHGVGYEGYTQVLIMANAQCVMYNVQCTIIGKCDIDVKLCRRGVS